MQAAAWGGKRIALIRCQGCVTLSWYYSLPSTARWTGGDFPYPGWRSTTRVAVYIDWQNVYHCAREAFHDEQADPSRYGSARPGQASRVSGPSRVHEAVAAALGEWRAERLDEGTCNERWR